MWGSQACDYPFHEKTLKKFLFMCIYIYIYTVGRDEDGA